MVMFDSIPLLMTRCTGICTRASPHDMFDEVFAARRRETEGFFSRKIPTSENRVVRGYVPICMDCLGMRVSIYSPHDS